ncbi:MAG: ATPase V [Spirochaetales bacterium]|nr:ATPase V [Spirochaetales bacterium]
MIVTQKMKQLIAVIRNTDADDVTKVLLNAGVLHFSHISDFEKNVKLDTLTPQYSQTEIADTRRQIENYLAAIKVIPHMRQDANADTLKPLDITEITRFLDSLSRSIQEIRNKQKDIQQDILKLEDIRRQLDLFGDIRAGLYTKSSYSFLTFQTGRIITTRIAEFGREIAKLPSVQLNFSEDSTSTNILLITMKRDDRRVNEILSNFGWVDIQLTANTDELKENVFAGLEQKINKLHKAQEELKDESDALIFQKKEELETMWLHLRMNELYYRIQSFYSRTSRTMVFTGWVPADCQKVLEKSIIKATGGVCYLEWHTTGEVERQGVKAREIPVQLKNPNFLSPFQMLVTNYSIPEYGTIDPTPFVAVTYFIMFGLMFGDVCQGIIIGLLGVIGSLFFRKKDPGMYKLSNLIIYCGASATIAGALFGSYFGFEWFKPLWFNFHAIVWGRHELISGPIQSIYDILAITIYFGIAVITLGLFFNWINLIAKKNWFKLIFDKGGFVGSFLYFTGVYTAYYYVTHGYKELPDAGFLGLAVGIPVLLFLVKPPIEYLRHKKHNANVKFSIATILDFLMEWIVELLEIFSGYLANTLSFMRVAGLGIAHVCLMISFTELARMAAGNTMNFNAGSIIILIFGNALVIALEGFSAGIQSLRLTYYEFFSKYFAGNGKAYSPVSLRNR